MAVRDGFPSLYDIASSWRVLVARISRSAKADVV